MNQFILETEDIFFTYPDGTCALNGLTMAIPRGEKVAVVGQNGAGKTTLFLHFNGINRPSGGKVKYRGQDLGYSTRQLKELRKNVGLVFQDPDNQLFAASLYQDVSFGPLNLGWPEQVVRSRVEQALRETGIWELKDRPVHLLSFGQKKRAAIAGVLAMEPEVIILDEPTSGLDPQSSRTALELLNALNRRGKTVLISSHQIDEVLAWADLVFVLEQGRVIARGDPAVVLGREEILQQARLVKPWVLEVYQQLLRSGRVEPQPALPRSREDILRLLLKLQAT